MTESESVSLLLTARLQVPPAITEAMRHAGARDSRLGADQVSRTARLAVAAWAMAVDGDGSALAAMAGPDVADLLLHPVRKPWQVAPGPRVTQIELGALDAGAEPPRLRLRFEFTGRRRFADAAQADSTAYGETAFIGLLDLTLAASGPSPWHLSSGQVQSLDDFLGYKFISRRETPEEYRERTGPTATPAAAAPCRVYRLTAGFAEHDERFGSSASIDVPRETAPTPNEAEKLVWPAVEEVTRQALGAGDWRPSLNWLDVIELLGE